MLELTRVAAVIACAPVVAGLVTTIILAILHRRQINKDKRNRWLRW